MMDQHTRPHFGRAALITIDTQNDTLDGQPLEVPGTSAMLPKLRELVDAFRHVDRPIVHIVRIYKQDGSNVDACRRASVQGGKAVLAQGTPGAQLAAALFTQGSPALDFDRLLRGEAQSVGPNEVVLYKPRWGAFYQTRLEDYLRDRRVDTLVFAGCNFPNCPRTSMYEASERDFRVALAQDAISGLYDRGRVELTNIGVQLLNTLDVVRELKGADRR